MEAQEIYEQLNKGEWQIAGLGEHIYVGLPPKNGGDVICLSPIHEGWQSSQEHWRTNAAAIVSAVNGTYGQGIDPSKVIRMRDMIKAFIRVANNDQVADHLVKQAVNLLNSATLK